MSDYNPDRWVIIETVTPEETIHKVFGGWYGGYTGSDSWRLNSGISKVEKDGGNHFLFHGYSGSTYCCRVDAYGMSGYMSSVYHYHKQQVERKEGISFRFLSFDEMVKYAKSLSA